MANGFRQLHRDVSITTPLRPDAVLMRRMRFEEGLNRLFSMELVLLSDDFNIAFDDVLGQRFTVSVETGRGTTRFFDGFVSEFCQVGTEGKFARYEARVVPSLWTLTRRSNSRIFQQMNVWDIVHEILQEHGIADFELRFDSSNYPVRDYVVQYRETDFNFVSRLLEKEGICYYFEHDEGKHTLVLTDSGSQHEPTELFEALAFRNPDLDGSTPSDTVSLWVQRRAVQSGQIALRDYDFAAPKKDLTARAIFQREHALSDFEVFEYPGKYLAYADGERYARVHIEEIQSQHETATGETGVRGLAVGRVFELVEHPRVDFNDQYLVVSATHEVEVNPFESQAEVDGLDFRCKFMVVPSFVQFRPPRLTPKSRVEGPQTALVTGPAGELAYTDQYGRVKVQFHWDREGNLDQNTTCWVRVSQHWAGAQYGSMMIPHVGQEVIVDFLEGDPDSPIVTGRVYNADNMPPDTLPDQKMRNYVARDHFGNEIMFDHNEGNEHIRIYSPHHESLLEVGKSVKITTSSDTDNYTVGNSESTTYGNTYGVQYGHSHSEFYGTKVGVTAAASFGFGIGADASIFVGGKGSFFLGGSFGCDLAYKFGITKGWEVSVGSQSFSKNVDENIILDSDGDFLIKGGPSNNGVVTINSEKIDLNWGSDTIPQVPNTTVINTIAAGVAAVAAGLLVAAAATSAGATKQNNILDQEDPRTDPSDPDDPNGPTVMKAAEQDVTDAETAKNDADEQLEKVRQAREDWLAYEEAAAEAEEAAENAATNASPYPPGVRDTALDQARDDALVEAEGSATDAGLNVTNIEETDSSSGDYYGNFLNDEYEDARLAAIRADADLDFRKQKLRSWQVTAEAIDAYQNESSSSVGYKDHEHTTATATGLWIATGVAGTAALVLGVIAAYRQKKAAAAAAPSTPRVQKRGLTINDSTIELWNESPTAFIHITPQGAINLENPTANQGIYLICGGANITLDSDKAILLKAPDVQCTQGKWSSKNIADLG